MYQKWADIKILKLCFKLWNISNEKEIKKIAYFTILVQESPNKSKLSFSFDFQTKFNLKPRSVAESRRAGLGLPFRSPLIKPGRRTQKFGRIKKQKSFYVVVRPIVEILSLRDRGTFGPSSRIGIAFGVSSAAEYKIFFDCMTYIIWCVVQNFSNHDVLLKPALEMIDPFPLSNISWDIHFATVAQSLSIIIVIILTTFIWYQGDQ